MTINKKPYKEKIFEEIIAHLNRMSYSQQKAVAEEAEVHYNTLYWWITGVVMNPRFNTLIRVARAMGYEVVLNRPKRHLKRVS